MKASLPPELYMACYWYCLLVFILLDLAAIQKALDDYNKKTSQK